LASRLCRLLAYLVRDLNQGGSGVNRPSSLAIVVALTLAAVGLAMAVYLVLVGEPKQEEVMTPSIGNGIVSIPASHSVDQTVETLEKLLRANGVKLFALVDHSGEAEKAGMEMRPTKLVIFGSPKAGTPLMTASPGVAIDLPLKILVWEDGGGKVWVSYNSPSYLQARHNLRRARAVFRHSPSSRAAAPPGPPTLPRAAARALRRLGEFPDVEMPRKTSPSTPCAWTWRENSTWSRRGRSSPCSWSMT